MRWWTDLGLREDHLRIREHDADELSHYSKRTVDIEYRFPFTDWGELEGIANRTDFDLKAHQEASGEDLTYFDQEKNERYHPYVIEPAAGVDRAVLAFLLDAYREEEAPTAKGGTEKRTYLALDRRLAPTKVAVLPLSRNEKLTPEARRVFDLVKAEWMCDFDDAGSIGRRYRRQDEVGTPFCVTVDFDSIDDAPGHRPRAGLDGAGPPADRRPRRVPVGASVIAYVAAVALWVGRDRDARRLRGGVPRVHGAPDRVRGALGPRRRRRGGRAGRGEATMKRPESRGRRDAPRRPAHRSTIATVPVGDAVGVAARRSCRGQDGPDHGGSRRCGGSASRPTSRPTR